MLTVGTTVPVTTPSITARPVPTALRAERLPRLTSTSGTRACSVASSVPLPFSS
jgi:hypothetical protein